MRGLIVILLSIYHAELETRYSWRQSQPRRSSLSFDEALNLDEAVPYSKAPLRVGQTYTICSYVPCYCPFGDSHLLGKKTKPNVHAWFVHACVIACIIYVRSCAVISFDHQYRMADMLSRTFHVSLTNRQCINCTVNTCVTPVVMCDAGRYV